MTTAEVHEFFHTVEEVSASHAQSLSQRFFQCIFICLYLSKQYLSACFPRTMEEIRRHVLHGESVSTLSWRGLP
jgi:hypothetical protein